MSIHVSDFPLCRHTKTDGRRCKSPAVATSAFCYHHRRQRRIRPDSTRPRRAFSNRPLPPLRDFHAIQKTLGIVLNGLGAGRIDVTTANQAIKLLQVASINLTNIHDFNNLPASHPESYI